MGAHLLAADFGAAGVKLAVVTGASAGIGLATARRFANSGYAIATLSRRPCPLPEATHVPCDLASSGAVSEAAATLSPLLAQAQQIALIHNAARLLNDTAQATEDDALRQVLEVNVVAVNALNRLAIPHMGAGSCILFVGSTLAEKAVPGSFSYVASKHAQVGMMRACCQDLAGSGIHTACICPGFTDTEMLREHVPADAMATVRGMSAFNRLIEPEEIAETLLWAAQAPVLNGSVIHANLGQVER